MRASGICSEWPSGEMGNTLPSPNEIPEATPSSLTSPTMFEQISDTEYRTWSDVRFRVVFDEAVVLKQDQAEVLVLNEVGGRVLAGLKRGLRPSQIVTELGSEFEASEDQLRLDVERFVTELVDAKVIAPANEDAR